VYRREGKGQLHRSYWSVPEGAPEGGSGLPELNSGA
jgi:hypothetical protein